MRASVTEPLRVSLVILMLPSRSEDFLPIAACFGFPEKACAPDGE
jgi:hypothetical protein